MMKLELYMEGMQRSSRAVTGLSLLLLNPEVIIDQTALRRWDNIIDQGQLWIMGCPYMNGLSFPSTSVIIDQNSRRYDD